MDDTEHTFKSNCLTPLRFKGLTMELRCMFGIDVAHSRVWMEGGFSSCICCPHIRYSYCSSTAGSGKCVSCNVRLCGSSDE